MSTVFEVRNGKPLWLMSAPPSTRRQDVARARAPQPERRAAFVSVVELGGAVGRRRVLEDLLVAHAHAAAGHDPEPVVAEPHDRQVGEDPAGRVEERRVDGPARPATSTLLTASRSR